MILNLAYNNNCDNERYLLYCLDVVEIIFRYKNTDSLIILDRVVNYVISI